MFIVLHGVGPVRFIWPASLTAGKDVGMRYLRIVMVCAIAAGALVVPSVAAAQISSIAIDQAQLGAQGAFLPSALGPLFGEHHAWDPARSLFLS